MPSPWVTIVELPDMPAEVIWEIFDNLEGETKQSLKALRLTSRAISPYATAGLFREISYTHGSIQSWKKIYAISRNSEFAGSVRTLKLRTSSRYYLPYSVWDSTLDRPIDLAQFRRLETFQCEEMWTMVKSNPTISLPKGGCELQYRPDMTEFMYEQVICAGYVENLHQCGFEYTSASINLLKPLCLLDKWEYQFRTIDLTKLRTLHISLRISTITEGSTSSSNPAAGILNLPSLTSFKLWQTVPTAIASHYRSVDVIRGLVRNKFNWPNLQEVDFRDVHTSAEDMRRFLSHYPNKLDSVLVHRGLRLQHGLGDLRALELFREGQQRILSLWILERVAPRKVDFIYSG